MRSNMEKGSPRLVMFAAALCVLLLYCPCAWATDEEHSLYYVTPNNSTVQCPDCFTLEDYVSNASYYFASNTTMVFLPGTHILEGNASVLIQNVTSLTLIGNTSIQSLPEDCDQLPSKIQCLGTIGFLFVNITDLHIEELAFFNCSGHSYYHHYHHTVYAALKLQDVHGLVISSVSLCNTSGNGIYADNILGNSTIQNTLFSYNRANINGIRTHRGGNAIFYYSHCPSTNQVSHLDIVSSQFLYGLDTTDNTGIAGGLTVILECENVTLNLDTVTVIGNEGYIGGNLAISLHVTDTANNSVTVSNSHFEEGRAHKGGGMYIAITEIPTHLKFSCNFSILLHMQDTIFSNNYANKVGGGLYLSHHESPEVFCIARQILIEDCVFQQNSIQYFTHGGVAAHLINFPIPRFLPHNSPKFNTVLRNCTFSENVFKKSAYGTLYVEADQSTHIIDCTFTNNSPSAIAAVRSNLLFEGSVLIERNSGTNGGGLVLCENSYMYLSPHTNITFVGNHANHSGGAIYAEDKCLTASPPCFFQLYSLNSSSTFQEVMNTVHINMINNTADYAGTALYGGTVEHCYMSHNGLKQRHYIESSHVFEILFRNITPKGISYISSDPLQVCFCDSNNTLECDTSTLNHRYFPGQTFGLQLVVVGQKNGAVPGVVLATFIASQDRPTPKLKRGEEAQEIKDSVCNELSYTIFSNQSSATLVLSVQQPDSYEQYYARGLKIEVEFKECPPGFALQTGDHSCNCIPLLMENDVRCDIDTQTILREEPTWIGFYNYTTSNGTKTGVIFCLHCPFDFCISTAVSVTPDNTDNQCAFNRTGIACGRCQDGFSLTLGSNQCRKCSNCWLLLLIPFALAGTLLVFIITFCNLTVTEGTINGLIFYANVVQINQSLFFPAHQIPLMTRFFTTFIAWLNLDLGIPVCFYDGMGATMKNVLQFFFPVYIWLISGGIIFCSRRYDFAARLSGRNAVKVLATLFLLSYVKIQRAIISVLSTTYLFYSDGSRQYIWLQDGNRYWNMNHIPLFVIAVLAFLCLSLPYTLLLLFIRCLHKLNLRTFSRLKPLFDAYTGPYKDKYQFWSGYLLMVRNILLLVYVLNVGNTGSHQIYINLLVSAFAFSSVLMLGWAFHGVYRKWPLDALEASFFLNLAVLSAVTAYHVHKGGNSPAVVHTSVGIVFLTFIGILIYHTCEIIRVSRLWKRFCAWVSLKRNPERVLEPVSQYESPMVSPCEELNETYGIRRFPPAIRFDQYREPLLASEDEVED